MHEDAGQAEFLLHPPRKLPCWTADKGQEVRKPQITLFPSLPFTSLDPVNIHEKMEIFLNRQILIETESLWHV